MIQICTDKQEMTCLKISKAEILKNYESWKGVERERLIKGIIYEQVKQACTREP